MAKLKVVIVRNLFPAVLSKNKLQQITLLLVMNAYWMVKPIKFRQLPILRQMLQYPEILQMLLLAGISLDRKMPQKIMLRQKMAH